MGAGLRFAYRIIAPPEPASGMINTFYLIETYAPRIEEAIPAYSAQLVVMVRGRLEVTYADGHTERSGALVLNAPQLRAAQCVIEGPALILGASLTHTAWQELANLPADAVHDRLIAPETVLGPEEIAAFEAAAAACAAGKAAPETLCKPLVNVVAARRHALNPGHRRVIEAVLAWLAEGLEPSLGALQASVDVSPRQLQRICRRFFGVPPAQVLKRFRALRAAMVLAQPALSEEVRAQLLASYFDQAHLIRDIRRYTGRTPSQLHPDLISSGLLDPAAHGEAAAPIAAAKP